MDRRHFFLVLCAFALVAALVPWLPAPEEAPAAITAASRQDPAPVCSDESAVTAGTPDPARVPPGCCTSNCTTDKDCNRICGKGNCVCIASSDCCRRCTF